MPAQSFAKGLCFHGAAITAARSFQTGFIPNVQRAPLEWSRLENRVGKHGGGYGTTGGCKASERTSRHAVRITNGDYNRSRNTHVRHVRSSAGNPEVLFFLTFTFVDFRAICVPRCADAPMRVRAGVRVAARHSRAAPTKRPERSRAKPKGPKKLSLRRGGRSTRAN